MPEPRNNRGVGQAHSKLILIGEHSVVYGKPAIALPFPTLHVQAVVSEQEGSITLECEYFRGRLEEVPHHLGGIALCIIKTLKTLNQSPSSLHISIHSTIPIGRGLGSSAAIAIAVVRSLYHFFHEPLPEKMLMRLVNIAETYAHGNPSGIDMIAAISDHSLWFEKGKTVKPITIATPFSLIVADTGRRGNTREAVQAINLNLKKSPETVEQSIQLLGELAHQAKVAIEQGEIANLGSLMNDAHTELAKLGVSDPGLDKLVELTRKAGAFGAKLTGGGRGGCMIALAKDETHAKKLAKTLRKHGAQQTWHFIVVQ